MIDIITVQPVYAYTTFVNVIQNENIHGINFAFLN